MNTFSIATLGGHSALEIALGAKKQSFPTTVIAQRGRGKTYTTYYKNLFDDVVIVDAFKQLTDSKIIQQLQEKNSIFIPHRYVQVYCDLKKFSDSFPVSVFGNKELLKYEDREGEYSQYKILDAANVEHPQQFSEPEKIDRLVIVKVPEAARIYERAFFFATDNASYQKKSEELIASGRITKAGLKNAIIEEYLIGAQINFNFFYSPLTESLELLGTDIRRQTNIDGLLRMPAAQQLAVADYVTPSYIETGHIAVTVKESLLEKAFELAEHTLEAARKISPPGIIGPFALQAAIIPGPPIEKIVVYDLSLRMPGSPGTSSTPYSQYHFGRSVSFGERIAMEIDDAIKNNALKVITT
jgi:5-formaminoimidazole-4-carboxamide-1-(beta)-D-ribofuranosyl 5'-monophosphate synthetase